ncbi:MAG: universal stress protein [Bacteroidales bacterium]|nr:universal stress protein [Bacteroidales bacterium]
MEKIIVGIDFSECSINALEHAMAIAKNANSVIILLWIENTNGSTKELRMSKSEAIKKLADLTEKYQKELLKSKIEYKIRSGVIFREIGKEAKESKASLIIIGTHGSGNSKDTKIGSNAAKIVTKTLLPVISIRKNADPTKSFKRIVIPIDSTIQTRQKVPFTTYLAKLFNSEIYILALFYSSVDAIKERILTYSKQTGEYFESEKLNFVVESMEAKNIPESLSNYAKKVDAGLIITMSEQELRFVNIWKGPFAQQMVNLSDIPICIYPTKSIYDYTSKID